MNYLQGLIDLAKAVESERPYSGYIYRISDVITILIIGLLCNLRSAHEIWQWSASAPVRNILKEHYGIERTPCYAQFMNILGNVKADSLNQLFMSWCATLVDGTANQIVAIDGKTIRSTGNIQACQRPLHIVSAYVSTCGLTIGQLAVDEKSNEIPAVQALIKLLDVKGTLVVADALNCQKNTAREVLVGGGDYLLAVKENQRDLHDDVKLFMTSERETMEHFEKSEKGHGRIETRKAWVSHDVSWYEKLNEWEGLCCLGAVRRICRERDKTSDETRFYISSRKLTAEELLQASRSEWGVESMHWMLDVIFGEDRTMLMEDNAQRTLNILRKTALNLVHLYKTVTNSKQSYVGVMRNNLFNPKLEPVDIK